MLDDNHCVADVTQVMQGFQQAVIVALVQADGGFVQYVHDACQPGADLRSEADALCFSAGKGFRRAIEGQIVESDIDQELQAGGDFLEHLFSDLCLVAGELEVEEVITCLLERQAADLVQGQCLGTVTDVHVAGFFAQTSPIAVGAGLVADQFGEFFAYGD